MRKTETMQQLAAASNAMRLNALGKQIEDLRQAKLSSAEELAARLEPLAQAMAALTDETRLTLEKIGLDGTAQAEQFRTQIASATTAWQSAEQAAKAAAAMMDATGRQQTLGHYVLVIVIGLMTGLLTNVSSHWLVPSPTIRNVLDAKELAALIRPEIAVAKPRKGK